VISEKQRFVKYFKVSAATGVDNIQARFLGDGNNVIDSSITDLIDLVLCNTYSHMIQKKEEVYLCSNEGKTEKGNFRLVSVHPPFIKFEMSYV